MARRITLGRAHRAGQGRRAHRAEHRAQPRPHRCTTAPGYVTRRRLVGRSPFRRAGAPPLTAIAEKSFTRAAKEEVAPARASASWRAPGKPSLLPPLKLRRSQRDAEKVLQ